MHMKRHILFQTEKRNRFSFTRTRDAFTLVEMMVVISILVMFLAFGSVSGGVMKEQLAFFRDQQVIVSEIYKARAKAVSTLSGESVCGYGVMFSGSQMSGFTIPVTDPSDKSYDCIEYYSKNPLQMSSTGSLRSLEKTSFQTSNVGVVFIKPVPAVQFVNHSGNTLCLPISGGSSSGGILISNVGQVSIYGSTSCN